jgi:hypothetical protein
MDTNASNRQQKHAPRARSRVRFEIVLASILLAFGLFVLPAMIYWVGILLLGPYGEGSGLGRFYADFFGDLVAPSARTWALALGPLVLISLLRLIFLDLGSAPPDEEEDEPPRPSPQPKPAVRERSRVEPRVSLE